MIRPLYLNAQKSKCAICKTKIELNTAHLDHNHKSGKIRGVLCQSCNLKLGIIEASKRNIIEKGFKEKAIYYTENIKYNLVLEEAVDVVKQ